MKIRSNWNNFVTLSCLLTFFVLQLERLTRTASDFLKLTNKLPFMSVSSQRSVHTSENCPIVSSKLKYVRGPKRSTSPSPAKMKNRRSLEAVAWPKGEGEAGGFCPHQQKEKFIGLIKLLPEILYTQNIFDCLESVSGGGAKIQNLTSRPTTKDKILHSCASSSQGPSPKNIGLAALLIWSA